jgi:hypothetical protein
MQLKPLFEFLKHHPQAIVILRHAHRYTQTKGTFGNKQPLSQQGKREAFYLGKQLSTIPWKELHTSPLIRCVQTSEQFLKGFSQSIPIIPTKILGDPGIFIDDSQIAGSHFLDRPWSEIAQDIIQEKPLPGIRSIKEGCQLFMNYVLNLSQFPILMITHDIIICLLCSYLFSSNDASKFIPNFLEGFCLSLDSSTICFRNQIKSLSCVF